MMPLFTKLKLPLLILYVVNTIINVVPTAALANPVSKGYETDRLALLAIKSQITDPHGVLNSWNESTNVCLWKGIICGRRHTRVTTLDLTSNGLLGSLSPFVGNLSFLRYLSLDNNTFTGHIPPEIGRLFRLNGLVLGNNLFQGEIPTNISGCMQLSLLDLTNNKLVGKLPSGLSSLSKLERLALNSNNITGDLSILANLSSLIILSLSNQFLQGPGYTGKIPDFIGNFRQLTILDVGGNSFTGQIPPSLYNLSNLQSFSLAGNLLQGVLPPDFGFCFPLLQLLELNDNYLSGHIPASLSNLSRLEVLDLTSNNFTGKFLFDGSKMPELSWLNIEAAIMGRGEADELDFMKTLVNCTYLQVLLASDNNLGGNIPHSIANFSTNLAQIDLYGNRISGTIPSGLDNLLSLDYLFLANNQLTGTIPADIGKIPRLERLYLHNNKLSGSIPSSLGNLSWLSILTMSANNFQGFVPVTLGNCSNLLALILNKNNLVGKVPYQIFQVSSLVAIVLAYNNLQGSLPSEIGQSTSLTSLDMSYNNLSGSIPTSLSQCFALTYLHLQENSFSGFIPPSFSLLKSLENVDLSRNKLMGQVPNYFSNFSALAFLNLSFNNLEGDVPTLGIFANAKAIFLNGNNKLCGGIPQLKLPSCPKAEDKAKRKSRALVIAICVSCFLLGLIIVSIAYLACIRRKKQTSCRESLNKEPYVTVSYDMLLKATDGFSPANLIGSGSFSSVYKGTILLDGVLQDVAVKVINNQIRGASKSFLAECEALRIIRHRNLVGVITACSSIDFKGNVFKALVYEFMSKGNLEQWLPPIKADDKQFQNLSLLQRLNIATDIAYALDYLHNGTGTSIIHCDLKPTNILLDEDLTAHVGDFGLVKLLPEISEQLYNNSSAGIRGTIGYAAPEYGLGTSVSAAGDVYSYGIILLEIVTAKKPTDSMFEGDMSLHNFAESALPEHMLEIVDPTLLIDDNDEEKNTDLNKIRIIPKCAFECIKTMIMIGLRCSSELPSDRMDIKDVIRQLQLQRDHLSLCERRHRCEQIL